MQMPEELLYFIWRFRLFDQSNLKSLGGDELAIKVVGQQNRDAGPDFLMARIQIGTHEWNGHVEMHWADMDWYAHNHHRDPAYNNVILHVVWTGSGEVGRSDGTYIPTLCLSNYVDGRLLSHYNKLMNNMYWIPCQNQLPLVKSLYINQWLSRLTVERLETKFEIFQQQLLLHHQDFEKITFMILARAFGQRVNADSFQELAECIPLNLVHKYKDNAIRMEALFLGVAGFLAEDINQDEPYIRTLVEEFAYLKNIHALSSMDKSRWKLSRMRPYNFPAFRIAQLAALYRRQDVMLFKILELNSLTDVRILMSKIKLSAFWESHFTLEKHSPKHVTHFSSSFVDSFIINGLVHVVFLYGKYFGQELYLYRAISWLEEVKAESNSIIKEYRIRGVKVGCAATSQALLHLKNAYCDKKRCLNCEIGLQILRSKEHD